MKHKMFHLKIFNFIRFALLNGTKDATFAVWQEGKNNTFALSGELVWKSQKQFIVHVI